MPTKMCIYLTVGHMVSMLNVFHLSDSFFSFSGYRGLDILLYCEMVLQWSSYLDSFPLIEYVKYI